MNRDKQIEGDIAKLKKKYTESEVAELAQAHEMLSESYDALEKTKDELLAERSRLILENERLKRNNTFLNNTLGKNAQQALEVTLEEIEKAKANTVREMQERLGKHFCHDPAFLGVEQRLIMDVIDQIAKEMLEGEDE